MPDQDRPVRVLVVDDHPALQSGLSAVLEAQPGFVPLGVAADETELWPRYHATQPDIVVMDYHLPRTDGLQLCRRLKELIPAPAVLIYSAYADSQLVVPAMLAGADALLNKATPATELFAVMSRMMAGERVLPPLTASATLAAVSVLSGRDAQIIRCLLDGGTPVQGAEAVGGSVEEVRGAVDRALEALRVEVSTVPKSA